MKSLPRDTTQLMSLEQRLRFITFPCFLFPFHQMLKRPSVYFPQPLPFSKQLGFFNPQDVARQLTVADAELFRTIRVCFFMF